MFSKQANYEFDGHYLDSVSYVLLHFLTLRLFEYLAPAEAAVDRIFHNRFCDPMKKKNLCDVAEMYRGGWLLKMR